MYMCFISNLFSAWTLLHMRFQWRAGGIAWTSLLICLILHDHIVLERRRRRLPGWFCCSARERERGALNFRDKKEGCRERERDTETLSCFLPSLCQASVPRQLSEERQIKVRRDRQAKETCCRRRAPV